MAIDNATATEQERLEAFEAVARRLSAEEVAATLGGYLISVSRDPNDDRYVLVKEVTLKGLRRELAEQQYLDSLLPDQPVTLDEREAVRSLLRQQGMDLSREEAAIDAA